MIHMLLRIIVIVNLLILLCIQNLYAWEAEIVRITDGDTIVVKHVNNSAEVSIRLYGVDAPEQRNGKWGSQPFSKAATTFLQGLLSKGSHVVIIDMGQDRYKRTIASVVTLPKGKIVQEELLEAGFAWVYTQHCRGCNKWRSLQEKAKAEQLGLWADTSPISPWRWRKKSKLP